MTNELPKNIEYLISAYGLGVFIIIAYLIATLVKLKKIDLKLDNSRKGKTSKD